MSERVRERLTDKGKEAEIKIDRKETVRKEEKQTGEEEIKR